MMTRKDYIVIADALRIQLLAMRHDVKGKYKGMDVHWLRGFMNEISDALQADNPRFNHQKFIEYIVRED